MEEEPVNRRDFVSGASAAIGGAIASPMIGMAAESKGGEAVAETAYGKVRGLNVHKVVR